MEEHGVRCAVSRRLQRRLHPGRHGRYPGCNVRQPHCAAVVKLQQRLSVTPVCLCVKVLLDDSIINVGTVASSRYVAPMKRRVNELLRQLILFNQTLVRL